MIETTYGIFTNNEVTGQTAQEVYDEWLINKDKPQPISDKERIDEIEVVQNKVIDTIALSLGVVI